MGHKLGMIQFINCENWENAVQRLLSRIVEERCGTPADVAMAESPRIIFEIQHGIGEEGYRIEDGSNVQGSGADISDAVCVQGNDGPGLIFGLGRLLREASFINGRFEPGAWRGTSVPKKRVRAMYFATHFHNFYHDAPIEAVCRYIEDLALWGCNTLGVWFDMHHLGGIDSPEAVGLLERLHTMLEVAVQVGIRPALLFLANEDYANSPEELRADWTAGHDGYTKPPGGHYHREICPSKPGGLDRILKTRREVFEKFSDIDFGYIIIWPYDQGGCTCTDCAPWGANGYLKTAKPIALEARAVWPGAKTILSTWYFDHFVAGEWDGLSERFVNGAPDWVDYLLADDYGHYVEYLQNHEPPGELPIVSFPEISMHGMWPWGGFGANPQPRHWQEYWDIAGSSIDGFFPYSEGIYEDLNKVLMIQKGWDPQASVRQIVTDYASGIFSHELAQEITEAIYMMEEDHIHALQLIVDETAMALPGVCKEGPSNVDYEVFYRAEDLPKASECLEIMNRVDDALPQQVKEGWRWRVLWLRAALDVAIRDSAGTPSEETDGYFEELKLIYQSPNAQPMVQPPSRAAIKDTIREKGWPQT